MAFRNGGQVVTGNLSVFLDAGNDTLTDGTNTFYNGVHDSPIKSATFDQNNGYAYIENGTIFVSGSQNNSTDGDFVVVTGNIAEDVNNDFTTSVWAKRTELDKVVTLCGYRYGSFRLDFVATSAQMIFRQREITTPYTTNQTAVSIASSMDVWDFYSLSKSADQFSFYKNGILAGANSFTMTETITSSGTFHIGITWADDDYKSNGSIAHFGPWMHYTRALSAEEIYQNYNATKGRFT